MNKKILAILMALLMVLVNVAAFAEEADKTTANIPLIKNYTSTNEALFPSENVTFNYQLIALSATDDGSTDGTAYAGGPVSGSWTEKIDGSKEWTAPLTFSKVGKYTYKITEAAGNAAGVTYGTDAIYVQVMVSYDDNNKLTSEAYLTKGEQTGESKNDRINNSFSEADLTVTKTITGNMADIDKTFEIVVTLNSEKPVFNTITVTDAGELESDNSDTATIEGNGWTGAKVVKLTVGNNSEFVISGIPVDADKSLTYTVVETNPAPYTATGEVKVAAAFSGDTTVAVTNEYNATVDTGVNTDSLPYFMLLAFVMILAAAVVLKKRTVNE